MKSRRKFLLLYKRSALSVATKKFPKLRSAPNFHSNHINHYKTLSLVEEELRRQRIPYDKYARGRRRAIECYDLIITVGGDGTLIEAARSASKGQVILGVNSDPQWSVGKFCHADSASFSAKLNDVISKKAIIKPIYKMNIEVCKNKKSRILECINDVLISHINPAAMSRYKISINEKTEEHRSSGLWVSTAAGSTGAMASAGGVCLTEQSKAIQYKARELYFIKGCNYSLMGGVINPDEDIGILSLMSNGAAYMDGAHIKMPIEYGDRIIISHSENFVNLVY